MLGIIFWIRRRRCWGNYMKKGMMDIKMLSMIVGGAIFLLIIVYFFLPVAPNINCIGDGESYLATNYDNILEKLMGVKNRCCLGLASIGSSISPNVVNCEKTIKVGSFKIGEESQSSTSEECKDLAEEEGYDYYYLFTNKVDKSVCYDKAKDECKSRNYLGYDATFYSDGCCIWDCTNYSPDSDGDTWSDDQENDAGTDPNDPNDYPGSDSEEGTTNCNSYCTGLSGSTYDGGSQFTSDSDCWTSAESACSDGVLSWNHVGDCCCYDCYTYEGESSYTFEECEDLRDYYGYDIATIASGETDSACYNVASYSCESVFFQTYDSHLFLSPNCCLYSCMDKSCDEWVDEIMGSSYDGFCGSDLPPDGCIDWKGDVGLPLNNADADAWCGDKCCYYADPEDIRYTDEWCENWCKYEYDLHSFATGFRFDSNCYSEAGQKCSDLGLTLISSHAMNYCCCYDCGGVG